MKYQRIGTLGETAAVSQGPSSIESSLWILLSMTFLMTPSVKDSLVAAEERVLVLNPKHSQLGRTAYRGSRCYVKEETEMPKE